MTIYLPFIYRADLLNRGRYKRDISHHRKRGIFSRGRSLNLRGNFRERRKKGDNGIRRPGKSIIKMYEVFRLREEEESSAKARNPWHVRNFETSLLATSTCCPDSFLVSCITFSPFFVSYFFPLLSLYAHVTPIRDTRRSSALRNFIYPRVANSRGTFCADYSRLFKGKQRRPHDDVFARARRKTKYLTK